MTKVTVIDPNTGKAYTAREIAASSGFTLAYTYKRIKVFNVGDMDFDELVSGKGSNSRFLYLTHPDTGEVKNLNEWADTLDIHYSTLLSRHFDYKNGRITLRSLLSPKRKGIS